MGPMKLYRLLQAHVGMVNQLVVALYKEEIEAEDAQAQAQDSLEKTLAAVTESEKAGN